MQSAFYGFAGERLTADERDFFRDADPAGYIVFARNCTSRDQVSALTDELRSIHGRAGLPILIDQEGGRVARMKPPHWPKFPAAEAFARLYQVAPISAIEAARANAAAIAAVLTEVGVNVDCLPVLDVRKPGATDIVGDRSFGESAMQVAALGRATLEGLASNGVVGVVKHMPGHGRALVDSHKTLPIVRSSDEELEEDLEPFAALSDAPMGMVAHLVFTAWDEERPASLSRTVIDKIIRGRLGFDGFLMTDDIGMHALTGGFDERTRLSLDAGNDAVLHCSGKMEEMIAVASEAGTMPDDAVGRLERAMGSVSAGATAPAAYEELAAKRDELLALA
jgi:beta-N-acetylhexosaminidase